MGHADPPDWHGPFWDLINTGILDMEPPNHTRVRRFGAGIHFCLGAPLGRQELQVSFTTLMDRFPNLELVEEPAWRPNYVIRGLEGLRVRA